MSIAFLPLEIECCFLSPAVLPAFKGSTFRGAFGHALKMVACSLRKQQCDDCLLANSCAFSLIFATEKIYGERVSARPHPYIIKTPLEEKRNYLQGESLRFGLVLLGPAVSFLPHIIYCLEEMGKNGLGKGAGGRQGQFALSSVTVGDRIIYRGEEKRLLTVEPSMLTLTSSDSTVSALTVILHSPLRLKFNNSFLRHIDFPHLVRAALRRVRILENCYGDPDISIDFQRLCKDAEHIAVTIDNTHWQEYRRYSNRQKKSMLLGGVLGKLSFTGDLAPYLPYFRYVEQVGLGKQTAFGLGRLEIRQESTV